MVIITQLPCCIFLSLSLLFAQVDNKEVELEMIYCNVNKVEFFTSHLAEKGLIVYKKNGREKKELYKIYQNSKESLVFNVYDKSSGTLEQVDFSGLKNNISGGQRHIDMPFTHKEHNSQLKISIKPCDQCLYLFISDKKSNQRVIVRINGNYADYKMPTALINLANARYTTKCKNRNLEFRVAEDQFQQGLEKMIINKKEIVYLHKDIFLTGKHVEEIELKVDDDETGLILRLNQEGSRIFADITTRNQRKRIAILVKGIIVIAPIVMMPIVNGEIKLSGVYPLNKAKDLFDIICCEEKK